MKKQKPLIVEKVQRTKEALDVVVTADCLKNISDSAKKDYQSQTKHKPFHKIVEMD